MSWGLYDELRRKKFEISLATSHQQADEILVDVIDLLSLYLAVSFPDIDSLSDEIVAEWRKKRDA